MHHFWILSPICKLPSSLWFPLLHSFLVRYNLIYLLLLSLPVLLRLSQANHQMWVFFPKFSCISFITFVLHLGLWSTFHLFFFMVWHKYPIFPQHKDIQLPLTSTEATTIFCSLLCLFVFRYFWFCLYFFGLVFLCVWFF